MHSTNKADIIGVSETWLHADIPYSESEVKGYCMYRGDRTHGEGEDACSISRKTSGRKRW